MFLLCLIIQTIVLTVTLTLTFSPPRSLPKVCPRPRPLLHPGLVERGCCNMFCNKTGTLPSCAQPGSSQPRSRSTFRTSYSRMTPSPHYSIQIVSQQHRYHPAHPHSNLRHLGQFFFSFACLLHISNTHMHAYQQRRHAHQHRTHAHHIISLTNLYISPTN